MNLSSSEASPFWSIGRKDLHCFSEADGLDILMRGRLVNYLL
jgi:hypothetical protein